MKTRIRKLRKEKDITQMNLALSVGCAQNTISEIENNLSNPNSELLFRIADYFNVTLDYLLFKTNQREASTFSGTMQQQKVFEYLKKVLLLPQNEQEAIFLLIDCCTRSHKNEG